MKVRNRTEELNQVNSENNNHNPKKMVLHSYLGYFKYDVDVYSKVEHIFTVEEYKKLLSILNSITTQTKKNIKRERKVDDPRIIQILYFWSWISIYMFMLLAFIGAQTYSYVAIILAILCLVYIILVFSGLFFVNFFSKEPVIVSYEDIMSEVAKSYLEDFRKSYKDQAELEFFSSKDPWLRIIILDADFFYYRE
mmetsp:Transcript_199/g.183  ORF Transcript_199/g.183 Transcript_199/m.183 type:complete len:195 (-) Transcript_199:81-665(-)